MFGWRRQHVDIRDTRLKLTRAESALPSSATLLVMPEVRDQGNIGSCTAHSGTEAAGYLYMIAGRTDPMFSRLDLYASTRAVEGTPLDEDGGCQVRSVFKAMRKYGVCLESTWPYTTTKFAQQPSRAAVIEALNHRAVMYLVCDGLQAIKHSIVDMYPIIGGFDCYSSMFTPQVEASGIIPMPGSKDQLSGGHCVLFVGYDDTTQQVQFLNSWGPSWGKQGFGFLPYDYFNKDMASDFWTLRTEEM